MNGLAAELRAGGLMAAALAFGLGAIGTVALLAIIARRLLGHALPHRVAILERGTRVLQGIAAIGQSNVMIADPQQESV